MLRLLPGPPGRAAYVNGNTLARVERPGAESIECDRSRVVAGARGGTIGIRRFARKAAPLYWLAGMARYAVFRVRLAREMRRYRSGADRSRLPPPHLRYRVHGSLDAGSYEAIGAGVARAIEDCLRGHGIALAGLDILDFGCGPGRVAQHLAPLTTRCRLSGSDIDAEAIAWARAHLADIATFATNAPSPPLAYAAGSFDLVYTVSLFTHLDEPLQGAWLAELHRVLRPDGILLATVHGALAQETCDARERAALREKGFAFRVGRTGRLKLDGLPDFYQTAFHTREYIRAAWARWFDVESYIEGGLHGHQDIVLLRRRAAAMAP